MFVCTGNTCRSSMAQAIATSMLREMGLEDKFRVVSAGTAAWPGSFASPEAIEIMAKGGIDLNQHRAQSLSAEIAREADLILTMTVNHKNHVLRLVPEASEGIFTLKEYVSQGEGQAPEVNVNLNITDPFGQGPEVYEACARELEEQIGKALERFLKELGQSSWNSK